MFLLKLPATRYGSDKHLHRTASNCILAHRATIHEQPSYDDKSTVDSTKLALAWDDIRRATTEYRASILKPPTTSRSQGSEQVEAQREEKKEGSQTQRPEVVLQSRPRETEISEEAGNGADYQGDELPEDSERCSTGNQGKKNPSLVH